MCVACLSSFVCSKFYMVHYDGSKGYKILTILLVHYESNDGMELKPAGLWSIQEIEKINKRQSLDLEYKIQKRARKGEIERWLGLTNWKPTNLWYEGEDQKHNIWSQNLIERLVGTLWNPRNGIICTTQLFRTFLVSTTQNNYICMTFTHCHQTKQLINLKIS